MNNLYIAIIAIFIAAISVTSLIKAHLHTAHLHTVYHAPESGKESILLRSSGGPSSSSRGVVIEEPSPPEERNYSADVDTHIVAHANDLELHLTPKEVRGGKPAEKQKEKQTAARDHCQRMKYWERGSASHGAPWRSPWEVPNQYVTMEHDRGGWNNIRMAMENVIVFAHATGRTFVMPPTQPIYLLNKPNNKTRFNPKHGLDDFFAFAELRKRMKVISMEEFLFRQRDAGLLPSHLKPVPRQSTLDTNMEKRKAVTEYLRDPKVAENPDWKADKMGFVFPRDPNKSVIEERQSSDKADKEVRAFLLGREQLEYSSYIRHRRVIHFAVQAPPLPRRRLLTQAYLFQFFMDPTVRRVHLRLVRDFIHYRSNIFCTAERAIRHLLLEGNGSFSTLHVRRNDFQYKKVWLDAKDIVASMKGLLKDGELLYIATDEKNISDPGNPSIDFFEPLRKRYRLRFLRDVADVARVDGLGNDNLIGMFEQVVASQGRVFAGAWWSTFSGYIMRLRGYYGFNRTTSYFYWPPRKFDMHQGDYPVGKFTSSYAREWPIAWTDIDDNGMRRTDE